MVLIDASGVKSHAMFHGDREEPDKESDPSQGRGGGTTSEGGKETRRDEKTWTQDQPFPLPCQEVSLWERRVTSFMEFL